MAKKKVNKTKKKALKVSEVVFDVHVPAQDLDDISQYEGLERKIIAINQRIDRLVNAISKSKSVRGL